MKKKFVFIVLTIFSLFFVPITYSKYTETVTNNFTLNVRQPRYHITYLDNDVSASIPSEYQKIEYIESTGTQYIDTGIVAKGSIGFELIFESKNKFTSSYPGYGSVFGARTSSSKNEIQITTYSTAQAKKGTFRYNDQSYNANINLETKNHISHLNNEYMVNGVIYEVPRGEFNSNQNITIFAVNNGGTITQYGHVKLYALKLYDNNILVRDFIPCFRVSDGEVGLYDNVTQTFYRNSGTEEFLVNKNSIQTFEYGTSGRLLPNALTRGGFHFINWNTLPDGTGDSYEDEATVLNLSSKDDDIINLYAQWKANEYYTITYNLNTNELPSGYRNVEFIESTGTQYLDTGIKPKGTIGFETKFYTNNIFSGSEQHYGSVFGGRDDSQNNEFQITTYVQEGTNYGTFRYANASHEANIELEKINNLKYLGTTYTTNKGTYELQREIFQSPHNMTVFAVNDGGEVKQFGRLKLYKLKIYDGDILVRNYVPCYRESDGEAGLYDMVNNTFITNLGTGEFIKEKIQTNVYEVKTNLEKIEYEKVGYTFHSWNTLPDGTGDSYVDEQSIKFIDYIENNHMDLYAQWTANNYVVRFNSNGGSGTMQDQQMTYDTQTTLNTNTFVNNGKRFSGWNTSPNTTGTTYTNNQNVLNLTTQNNGVVNLYAIWQ